ncbi:M23 family metallopeptidase [Candidatus Leptofilum sp.]|uniref:M23 family metallopeptidase n=1 Tax=Candidatus Leptofilum sp. TaxID=3241576 RepID=UPI003B5A8875
MKSLFPKFKQLSGWFFAPEYRWLKIGLALLVLFIGAFVLNRGLGYLRLLSDPRSHSFLQWAQGDSSERAALITTQQDACPGAPFILPTDGFIGLLYEDPRGPYSNSNPHQGIDIFSEGNPGTAPVYAAYDGYVTRDENWRSALIVRVPDDPLRPGEQIWLYYTHMADREGNSFIEPAFPPGTSELFVEQGTLLGYTGDYNGNATRNIWVHLHFSIVKDDGNGRYLNELLFENTLDPSPYLGMALNYQCTSAANGCTAQPVCNS